MGGTRIALRGGDKETWRQGDGGKETTEDAEKHGGSIIVC